MSASARNNYPTPSNSTYASSSGSRSPSPPTDREQLRAQYEAQYKGHYLTPPASREGTPFSSSGSSAYGASGSSSAYGGGQPQLQQSRLISPEMAAYTNGPRSYAYGGEEATGSEYALKKYSPMGPQPVWDSSSRTIPGYYTPCSPRGN